MSSSKESTNIKVVELLIEFRTLMQNIIFLLAIITMVVTETRRGKMEIAC